MTARQHVAETLKGVAALEGRVYFVERPGNASYPCAVYSPAGNRFLDGIMTPGASFASWFAVDARASTSGEAERLANEILAAFRAGGRMERSRDLSYQYEDADASPGGGPYGVYRASSGYLIREGG